MVGGQKSSGFHYPLLSEELLATHVIMPALEMAQENGKLLRWLKPEGAPVTKGEPIMEIETDKVTVEIEAPADGILGGIRAREGASVPVGTTIAWILAPGENVPTQTEPVQSGRPGTGVSNQTRTCPADTPPPDAALSPPSAPALLGTTTASPVALQIAREHGINLAQIKPDGGRIEKADVLAYIQSRSAPEPAKTDGGRLTPASPKARRLAREQGIDPRILQGSGPEGAVLAADVLAAQSQTGAAVVPPQAGDTDLAAPATVSTVWRVMAERMSSAWTTVPHFYLTREIDAGALLELRRRIMPAVEKKSGVKPTITDLLVKLVAVTLRDHPQVNASYVEGSYRLNTAINIGVAVAVDEGLIVPVIRNADRLAIGEIARARQDLVERATAGTLRPADIAGGTCTLTNLGMYGVDAFDAIVNTPQAAILAVGRVADRVVPVNGQPGIRPMMVMTLSCDHRVVDGARGARFLDDLARLIEEPWGLLA